MAKENKEALSETDRVKQEIEEMLAKAKEVAEGIIQDAKNQADMIRSENSKASDISDDAKASIQRGEELVEVMLFKDTGRYSDDVFVSVNGENCIIKRGEKVKIKRKFKEVLDNSMAQSNAAADMQKNLADDYEKKSRDLI